MSERLKQIPGNSSLENWRARYLSNHWKQTLRTQEDPDDNPRGVREYNIETFTCSEANCSTEHKWNEYTEEGEPKILACELWDHEARPIISPIPRVTPARQQHTIMIHLAEPRMKQKFENFLYEWRLHTTTNFSSDNYKRGVFLLQIPRVVDLMLFYRLGRDFISGLDTLYPYLDHDWLKCWCIVLKREGDEEFVGGKKVKVKKTIVKIKPDLAINVPLKMLSKMNHRENNHWDEFHKKYIAGALYYDDAGKGDKTGMESIGKSLDTREGSRWHPTSIYTSEKDRSHIEEYYRLDCDRILDPRKKCFREKFVT